MDSEPANIKYSGVKAGSIYGKIIFTESPDENRINFK
jgi:hypothetical protein